MSGEKTFSSVEELRKEAPAGYYWWCPEYLRHDTSDPIHWQIVRYHPSNDQFSCAGLFYGPIQAPIGVIP